MTSWLNFYWCPNQVLTLLVSLESFIFPLKKDRLCLNFGLKFKVYICIVIDHLLKLKSYKQKGSIYLYVQP